MGARGGFAPGAGRLPVEGHTHGGYSRGWRWSLQCDDRDRLALSAVRTNPAGTGRVAQHGVWNRPNRRTADSQDVFPSSTGSFYGGPTATRRLAEAACDHSCTAIASIGPIGNLAIFLPAKQRS